MESEYHRITWSEGEFTVRLHACMWHSLSKNLELLETRHAWMFERIAWNSACASPGMLPGVCFWWKLCPENENFENQYFLEKIWTEISPAEDGAPHRPPGLDPGVSMSWEHVSDCAQAHGVMQICCISCNLSFVCQWSLVSVLVNRNLPGRIWFPPTQPFCYPKPCRKPPETKGIPRPIAGGYQANKTKGKKATMLWSKKTHHGTAVAPTFLFSHDRYSAHTINPYCGSVNQLCGTVVQNHIQDLRGYTWTISTKTLTPPTHTHNAHANLRLQRKVLLAPLPTMVP